MALLGVHLTILAGPAIPIPLPAKFVTALSSATVTHSDEGRSGFQLTFQVGRGREDLLDYPLLSSPQVQAFSRLILVVTFGVIPRVLMDGIITNQQFNPSEQPGQSTFTLTGEDVSVMMDRQERSAEHPAQPEAVIALKIIASYAQYGLIPTVIPPPSLDVPLPIQRVPVQQGTDLQYLQEMANRFAYVFYVSPGPAPGTNMAYWGPPVRQGLPQPALTFNMGPNSNVTSLDFQNNALSPTTVTGQVQDRDTNQQTPLSLTVPAQIPLAAQQPNPANARVTAMRQSGLSTTQALTRAQAEVNASTSNVVSASGELDAGVYGGLLQARGLVGLRGAGANHDGLYYVKQVTHTIAPGSYKQRFTLTREGLGTTIPVVIP